MALFRNLCHNVLDHDCIFYHSGQIFYIRVKNLVSKNFRFDSLQDEKAIKVELDIQFAIQEYIVMECPQCNEAIFQGQRGMFVCHDNPHWPTYRITLNDEATSYIIYLTQEWVRYML